MINSNISKSEIKRLFNNVSEAAKTSFREEHATDVILENFGDTVSIQDKRKDLIKFGLNPAVGTDASRYTIWFTGQDQPNEVYLPNNLDNIDSISSSSIFDTQQIKIEGHVDVNGEKTFVVQTVTLQGTTRVPLTTPLNRVTRAYNSDSFDLVGEVYVYENTALTTGKPTDTTKIHITIPINRQQSLKASTSLDNETYWVITNFYGDVLTKVAGFADIQLEIRQRNGVFLPIAILSASDAHQASLPSNVPYIIAPKNSDIRLTAVGSGTIPVSGGISGFLAKIV